MLSIDEIRRANLGRLRDQHGGWVGLLRRLGRNERDATLGQIWNRSPDSKSGKPRTMGTRLARDLEAKLGLPSGWMDQMASSTPAVAPEPASLVATGSAPDWQDLGAPLQIPPARAVPVVGTARLGDNAHYVELEYPTGYGDGTVIAITSDANAYAVRCIGDSMQPRLQHGEFAVIEPKHPVTPGDEVLIKAGDGRVMIKRLRYQRDGRLYLDSINDAGHPPVILDVADVAAMHYVAAIVKRAYHRP